MNNDVSSKMCNGSKRNIEVTLHRNEKNTSSFKIEIMGEGKHFKEIRGFGDSYKLRLWSSYFMILVLIN